MEQEEVVYSDSSEDSEDSDSGESLCEEEIEEDECVETVLVPVKKVRSLFLI